MTDEQRAAHAAAVLAEARRNLEMLKDFKPSQRVDGGARWEGPAEPEPARERKQQPAAETDWSNWERWLRSHLDNERAVITAAVGEALGLSLEREREEHREELATEVRRLWAVIGELQATIA